MSKKKQTRFVWQYKDSHRFWWEISLNRSDSFTIGEEGDKHYYWDYSLVRDGKPIHNGYFLGEYDIPPTLDKIMLDFTFYITCVTVGASKHGSLKE